MGRVAIGMAALVMSAGVAFGVPPRVVRAVPDFADLGVDPGTKEIRIEFDQEMDHRGRSICGGGSEFPPFGKEIVWADAKTIVLPVTLEAGRRYTLSVNCGAAKNFRSATGEPAEEYPIQFWTGREGEAARVVTAEEAKGAARSLRKAIDERYSYRDLRVKDWDAVFAARGKEIEAARTPSELARGAARLLGAAEDTHVLVRIDGPHGKGEFTLPTLRRSVAANVGSGVPQGVTESKSFSHVRTGMFDAVPYVAVLDWMGKKEDYAPALDFIAAHQDAPGLIVDVRMNPGGDEMMARLVAGRFTNQPVVYSRHKSRDATQAGGWSTVADRTLSPDAKGTGFRGKVAVLIGPACVSSNESFILMMKHAAGTGGVTLVGARTFGASGNPRPISIGAGVWVVLPSWVDMTADGKVLEGKGIEPDVAVEWKDHEVDAVVKAGADAVRR